MTGRPLSPALRRPMAALAVGAALLALPACSSATAPAADGRTAAASPAPRGVITAKAAAAVVDRYVRVNNEANRERSKTLLATVEGGQLHAQSVADFEQMKTWPAKERKEYGSAFRYTHRTYLIPPADSGVDWFAVTATASGSKSRALLVFDESDGPTYKLVLAVYAEGKGKIPAIPRDRHGFVTPVDPADPVGDLAPDAVGAALSDLTATGGRKSGRHLATTDVTTKARKVHADRDTGKMSASSTTQYFAKTPAHPATYALRLADGGVLAAFPSSYTEETLLKPAYRGAYNINPGDRESIYDSTSRAVVTDEFQNQGLAVLAPHGKARVIAAEYRMVDSR